MAVTEKLKDSELLRTDPRTGALVSRQYHISVVMGPDQDREQTFSQTIVVGTQEDSQFRLTDAAVSRQHVELHPRADGLLVKDLGSTNGTFVGGSRIDQALLESDTTFRVGKTHMRVSLVERDLGIPVSTRTQFGDAVGRSAPMRRVFGMLERVASTSSPVLLLGETGTGKEVLARAIHAHSSRKGGPFVIFDAGAVSPNLIESELFGHVRGSFTGAIKDKRGLFEAADGGTLFLDEIGELPLELQVKLLRVLETGTVRRVGDENYRSADVRIVSATHRVLAQEVQARTFRQDLYFRLAVAEIHVPSLRERSEDIPLLMRKFLSELGHAEESISDVVVAQAMSHAWPGNVRELRNFVSRAILGADFVSLESAKPGEPGRPVKGPPEVPTHIPFKQAKEALVEVFTRDYMEKLLEQHGGNISKAAKAAGLARTYVHRLVDKYQLKVSD